MTKPKSTDQNGARRPRIRAVRAAVQPVAPPAASPSIATTEHIANPIIPNPPPRRRLPPRDEAATPIPSPEPENPKSGGAAVEPPSRRRKRKPDKPKRQPTGNYASGNCRPPEHGKIRKGEVRNPRGRPKGARGLNTIVRLSMEEQMVLRSARGVKKMTRAQALFFKLVEQGFGGNGRSAIAALNMYGRAAPEKPEEDSTAAGWTAENDEAIVAAFMASLIIGEAATPEDDEDIANEEDAAPSNEEGDDHE